MIHLKNTLIIFNLLFVSLIFGQNADEIIKKNLEKTGGLIEWKKLNSIKIKGEAILGVNEEYPIEIWQKRPNLSKTEMTIEGKKYIIDGFDGKNGYKFNFSTGKLEKQSNFTPESFEMDIVDYKSKGWKAEYKGKENINNKQCYKVILLKNTNKTTYYFDINTFYLIQEITKNETINYSNYKKNGNLYFAYNIENKSNNSNEDFTIKISSIEINKIINNNPFKF